MFDLETLRHVYLRRVVATTAGAVGFNATAAISRYFGQGVFGLNTLARRRAEARVVAALGATCSAGQAQTIVREMYANWGRFWAEALFIPRLLRESSWRQFVALNAADESTLAKITNGKRGCIFAAGYFGNPAVLADVLGRFARPIHVVVDFLAQPHLRRWQAELYSRPHIRPIERAEAALIIPKVLAGGGSVLLIAEHERRKGRAVPSDYLGSRIDAYPTIPRLARAFNAPVAAVSCRRNGDGFNFKLNVHDVIAPSVMEDESSGMRRILAGLQAAALESPEQYLWSVPIGTLLTQLAASVVENESRASSKSPGLQPGR